MATVLALDIGNTTTRFGLLDAASPSSEVTLLGSCEVTTHTPLTTDEARIQLKQVLSELPVPQDAPLEGAILACVVPTLTDVWQRALAAMAPTRPLTVGPGLRSGIKLRFNDPSEVGPDRIADVVAARAAYGAPAVVVDLGTTTNFEAIDQTGSFCGGIIAPGVALGARSLAEAAARLPIIELRAPGRVLGRSTREAMQSGVVLGEAARIDGLLDAVLDELAGAGDKCRAGRQGDAHATLDAQADVPVILTGEHAAAIATLLRRPVVVDDALTLRGLALLWQSNQR